MFFRTLINLALVFTTVTAQNATNGSHPLLNYGIVLFPAFTVLDVFGPLEALNMLALNYTTNLHIIADTMKPVSSKPTAAAMNKFNSSFGESVVPTHTFKNAPELDVLIIPGGAGTRAPVDRLLSLTNFVKERFPRLKHLITVCTGAGLAAQSGVLDGRRATGNKRAWAWVTAQGPNVDWISHARWVDDGKVWTTSGVSAGIDGTLAFVADKYGESVADVLATGMEYTRHMNASYDPWAEYYGLPLP